MQFYCVTPNDKGIMGADDTESIQNAVNHAAQTGLNQVVIPKNNMRTHADGWQISKSILLPSDLHLVLDCCYLRMEPNTEEAVFRNQNLFGIFGSVKQGEQRNIVITGGTESVIENAAGACFLFHNLQNLVLENFTCVNNHESGIQLSFCHNTRITDVRVKNKQKSHEQNGILVNGGCHQIIFENINCVGGSHVIKLDAKPEPLDYLVFEQKTCISDIVISNIYAEACRKQSICLHCSSRIFNVVTDEKSATQAEFIASKENDRFDIYNISLSNIF